uniref:Ig-like domain-containing protein n=1 Tax=Nothobranchius furzeri TaxID=105023 RepID=A0A8C6LA21_NOTFU
MDCRLSFEDKMAVLEIPKSKQKDSGTYLCTATNEAGSSSCQAVVTVQGKTFQVISSLSLDEILCRCNLCTIKGSPELHIHWYWNEQELSNGVKYKITFKNGAASLEILDLLVADSGTYTCEVSNNAGSDSCSTIVAVKGVHSDNNWNLLTSRGWIGGFKHQRVPEHGHSCSSPLPLGMRQKYVMMSNGTLTFSPKLTCFHISTCHVVL